MSRGVFVPTAGSVTRLRVYVSATSKDLEDHRTAVGDHLRKVGFEDASMDHYVAEETRPLARCLEDVRSSALYIGLFAWRYGFIPPGEERSITELEYHAAGDAGIDRLIFLARKRGWDATLMDVVNREGADGRRIEALRNELQTRHMLEADERRQFLTPDELVVQVAAALDNWKSRRMPLPPPPPAAHPPPRSKSITDYLQTVIQRDHLELSRMADLWYSPWSPTGESAAAADSDGMDDAPSLPAAIVDPFRGVAPLLAAGPGSVVVVGGPGAGKSTSMKQLQALAARRALEDAEAPIPLLIQLNLWEVSKASFDEAISQAKERRGLHDYNGSLLILADGLNEIQPAPMYPQRLGTILRWLEDEYNPHRAIFTTREHHYHAHGRIHSLPTIALNQLGPEQCCEMVRSLLPSEQAEALLGRLDWLNPSTPQIRKLLPALRTPYYLARVCRHFAETGIVPDNAVDLHRKSFRERYRQEQNRGTVGDVSQSELIRGLGALALSMYGRRKNFKTEYSVVESEDSPRLMNIANVGRARAVIAAAQACGLVEQFQKGRLLTFHHPLLQEYFAAEYLAGNQTFAPELSWKPQFQEYDRRESSLDGVFYALTSLRSLDEVVQFVSKFDPYFAFDLIARARAEQSEPRGFADILDKAVLDRLIIDIGHEDEHRDSAAIQRVRLLDYDAIPPLKQLWERTEVIQDRKGRRHAKRVRRRALRAAAQIDHVEAAQFLLKSALSTESNLRYEALEYILAARPEKRARIVRDIQTDSSRRERYGFEGPRIWRHAENAVRELAFTYEDAGDAAGAAAIRDAFGVPALAPLRQPDVDLFEDPEVKSLVRDLGRLPWGRSNPSIAALARFGPGLIPQLRKLLETARNPTLLRRLPRVLRKLHAREATPELLARTHHDHELVRSHCVRALAELGDATCEPRIRQLAVWPGEESDWGVRVAAIVALARLNRDSFVALAPGFLDDPSPGVRAATIAMLRKSEARELAPLVSRWLYSHNGQIVEEVVKTLNHWHKPLRRIEVADAAATVPAPAAEQIAATVDGDEPRSAEIAAICLPPAAAEHSKPEAPPLPAEAARGDQDPAASGPQIGG